MLKDKCHTVDELNAGLVEASPVCDLVMRAVDRHVDDLLRESLGPDFLGTRYLLHQAVADGHTTADEIVRRFERRLRRGL